MATAAAAGLHAAAAARRLLAALLAPLLLLAAWLRAVLQSVDTALFARRRRRKDLERRLASAADYGDWVDTALQYDALEGTVLRPRPGAPEPHQRCAATALPPPDGCWRRVPRRKRPLEG